MGARERFARARRGGCGRLARESGPRRGGLGSSGGRLGPWTRRPHRLDRRYSRDRGARRDECWRRLRRRGRLRAGRRRHRGGGWDRRLGRRDDRAGLRLRKREILLRLHLPPHITAVDQPDQRQRAQGEIERPPRVVVHFLDLKQLLRLGALDAALGFFRGRRRPRRGRSRFRLPQRQGGRLRLRRRGMQLRGQVVGENLQRLRDVGQLLAGDHRRSRLRRRLGRGRLGPGDLLGELGFLQRFEKQAHLRV